MTWRLFLLCCCAVWSAAVTPARGGRGQKYYDILEVSSDADDATLKKAYKKLAFKWHPDRNPTNQEEASKKFMEIGEAYEILSDPQKRAQYDQFGEAAFEQGGGGGGHRFSHDGAQRMFRWVFGEETTDGTFSFEFGDPWSFGGGRGGGGGRRQRRASPQDEDFYKDDPYVDVLTEENFEEDASGWVRLIEFYAPWCGHCRELSPKWSSLGKSLQGVVKVAAINCDRHESVCARHKIGAYPTIKAFLSTTDPEGLQYKGERTIKELKSWALSLIPNRVVAIAKPRHLEELFGRCNGSKRNDKADWKVCVLLFTEKTTTSALYKSLSFRYSGNIVFGEVRAKDASHFAPNFNVSIYPALVAVCNGNPKTFEHFQKKMQPDRIRTFLNSFTAGHKCNKAVSVTSKEDVEGLTAAQLKEILREHGISCHGCFERADYIKAAKEVLFT